jgi:hypothetical protein
MCREGAPNEATLKTRSHALVVCVAVIGALAPRSARAEPPPAPPAAAPAPPATANPATTTVSQPAPAPSPVPAQTPEEMRYRRVVVDVDSTRASAVLERRVSVTESDGVYFYVPFRATSSIWEQVCVTPCQVDLDRFSTYRVTARNGTSGSHSFTLPQNSQSLQLKVDAGDLMAHKAGIAVASTGLAAAIVGVALIAGDSLFDNKDQARDAGYITGAAGLVLMAVGIPLALATQTGVFSSGTKLAQARPGFTF